MSRAIRHTGALILIVVVAVVAVQIAQTTTVSAQIITMSRGDTVWSVARRYHVAVSTVIALNHLPSAGNYVTVGEKIQLPDPPVPTNRVGGPQGTRYPPAVVAAAERDRRTLEGRPTPSTSTVRSMVDSTARHLGVDPSLALAVADQESGFQQDVVSDADAIGAMQVLPATVRQMSTVAKRSLDALDAADNVTAGVLLLGMLTRSAPLDQAIAGYYQGLASVQKLGPFADTKRYVSDVLALRVAFSSGRR